jgi:enoyl-CoA hydratase
LLRPKKSYFYGINTTYSMRPYQTLLTELTDGILLITINREDKLNALNRTVIHELSEVMDEVYTDPSIHAAIITGSGPRAFAAGADISEFKALSLEDGIALSRRGHDTFNKIERSPKPVIAAVNGFALGGGCELAMSCHMRIASDTARFGQPEVNLGIIPGYGGTQRMVQLIGRGKALELLMTADVIDAPTALALGLTNHTVPQAELLDRCRSILTRIISKAPIAITEVIAAVAAHFDEGADGFEREIELFGKCVTTEDFAEGTAAFIEKRKADFKGK